MQNHIAHHLLTLFAIGADAGQIQRHYDDNASYQRPPVELSGRIVEDMSDYSSYKKYLGDEKYYHDFLIYFQKEIDKLGWKDTLHKHVFARDAHADDMLVRMFAGTSTCLYSINSTDEHTTQASCTPSSIWDSA